LGMHKYSLDFSLASIFQYLVKLTGILGGGDWGWSGMSGSGVWVFVPCSS
jgi:hypothetical protein